jgi:hypothetical protein
MYAVTSLPSSKGPSSTGLEFNQANALGFFELCPTKGTLTGKSKAAFNRLKHSLARNILLGTVLFGVMLCGFF